jgi:ParB family chromosome partitioning protein
VSDVKRIAKLFKDKEISDNTKNKLLYKSGRELVETWSVFEQNRAERAKAVEPKVPAKSEIQEKSEPATPKVTPIEHALQKISAALPVYSPFSLEVFHTIGVMESNDKNSFLVDINKLIDNLEKHLVEWKNVRELAASNEPSLLRESI